MSSVLGSGMKEFFTVMEVKKTEYEKEYKPELERRIKERVEEGKTEGLDKLMKDMNVGSTASAQRGISPSFNLTYNQSRCIWKPSQMERMKMMGTLSIPIQ